jgi:hypothetical protein
MQGSQTHEVEEKELNNNALQTVAPLRDVPRVGGVQ